VLASDKNLIKIYEEATKSGILPRIKYTHSHTHTQYILIKNLLTIFSICLQSPELDYRHELMGRLHKIEPADVELEVLAAATNNNNNNSSSNNNNNNTSNDSQTGNSNNNNSAASHHHHHHQFHHHHLHSHHHSHSHAHHHQHHHQHLHHSLQSGESGSAASALDAWQLAASSYASDQSQQQQQPAGSPNSNSNSAYGCAPLYDGAPYDVALGYGGGTGNGTGGNTTGSSAEKEYLYGK